MITPSETVAEKYLLVPDCDDDRHNHETGEFVNPRHKTAQANVYGTGFQWVGSVRHKVLVAGDPIGTWAPPLSLKIENGTRSEVSWAECKENESLGCPRKYLAGIWVKWRKNSDGTHRIVLWGGDDTYLERDGLTEAKASNLWARLQDFVTFKTLWRLGF